MLKALLPALAFFGSVAYATSGTGSSTRRLASKSSGSGFIDRITPTKGDSGFTSFSKGVAKYSYEGLFGKGGSLQQVSNTTIPARVKTPSVGGVQPV